MPIGYIVKDNQAKIVDLQKRLTAEWSLGTPPPVFAETSPVLIEEEKPARFGTARKPLHLYVIWDEWEDLPQQDRSEIIMDAYEATHATPDIVRVTLAMGLTKSEARKMGLNYRVSSPTTG
jgi:hypothetical protein